ncbi:ATPase [Aliiroseovarius crassostreae]|uniref:ATP12 family chaperone protein n=1 Tax=Aliiroseovarius crassostreae TaxID=154981 RepID=UPI0021FA7642|nr:ATP12 family protein [Aliiroseovarius crassostreae]UWQ11386.1 ATPase [Aliiroseovarius crassostreae]
MSGWAAKRFWKQTEVAEVEGGFSVTLDGRAIKTPAKTPFVVPTRVMAEAIAAEWDAQGDKIDPNTMPVTRTANSAIDKVATQFVEVADMLAAYGDSDLLCYRATHPQELIDRQAAKWDPVLDWAATALEARLTPVSGVIHAPQDAAAIARLTGRVHRFTPFELAAFHDLVGISGSLVLAFAVTEGHLEAEEAWNLSRLDEKWQEEQWGEDEEATAQADIKRGEFLHASRFFRHCAG